MTQRQVDEAIARRLESAEQLATAAVRTVRVCMPYVPPRCIVSVLDDVERLFAHIEATERMIHFARTAADGDHAAAYAEMAYALARLALDDASARVRAATAIEARPSGSEPVTARRRGEGWSWNHER